MDITPTELRRDLYRLLDEVLDSGLPLSIHRRGRVLRLVPDSPSTSLLDRIDGNADALVGDPDDLAEWEWPDR